MATYKVIQDIEAEDKLIGPFSFRQFVYILIAAFLGYLSFICLAKGAAFFLIIFVPPMLFCMFFAWPWSPDQPTEVWALARIRFIVKSRKRVWDQSGIKEFVTVTVPKKIQRNYTDGLTQTEVRSRLNALASTIDSRGWAVKNANLNDANRSVADSDDSDRLLGFSAMPQAVADVDVRADDDILDEANNPVASHMNEMIDAAAKAHRQGIMERLRSPGGSEAAKPAAAKQWFAPASQPGVLPSVMPAGAAMALPPKRQSANKHLKMVQPGGQDQPEPAADQTVAEPVVTAAPAVPAQPTVKQSDAAILNLAHDNNLDVATLAREAKKVRELDMPDGEVVVSLR